MTSAPIARPSVVSLRRRIRVTGLVAAAHWLLYVLEKLYLAATGTIGMVGSPAGPEAYQSIADPAAAQLGNAAAGLIPGLVLLVALGRVGRRVPRPVLLVALALVAAATLGLVVLLISHGNWPHAAVSTIGLGAAVAFLATVARRPAGAAQAEPVG
ncbi:MAG TPA: hypothetical protein VK020_08545 [Microlunatus sp.]|nr:hypothetical protein [Microlunatus sp.]